MKYPSQNGRSTQIQALGQHRHMHPHRQTNRDPQGQPGSQADPAMHHPAHHRAQGKDASPSIRRAAHQHSCRPSKNDRAKPSCGSPRANATVTQHILPYIGRGMVKTTNPKHTPPTRNHPADKQTPPQYKAEKPDATTEPSDAPPAAPTHGGHSRHAQDHCPNTTPSKKTPAKVHPRERKTHSIQVQEHARHPYTCQKQPLEKSHTETHKRQRAHRAKTKTHQEAKTSAPRDQPRPARLPKPCRTLRPSSPRPNRDRH
ncbi:hypothetical protein CRENBAI_006779 [Crenichthys baileyi]|uniref:Uncharacterized protein n=1 Tax=Crenichthys baileyi TaxID=28760 RepID=A0AAV9SEW6_9TELE